LSVVVHLPSGLCRGGEVPQQIDLFQGGAGGYHTYRIPAVVLSTKNTVLLFCEGRRKNGEDSGDIDLLLRRSTDGGKTWQPAKRVCEKDGKDVTFGNPCPVVERASGTIWLPFCRNNDRVFVTKSSDDGLTWDKPVEITKQVKKPGWGWYATGPGHGIQLQSGRLLIPCDDADRGNQRPRSHVFYSDDRGQTWKLGGATELGVEECEAVELADKSLLLSMRQEEGKPTTLRVQAASRDGGLTWSRPTYHKQVPCWPCQASVERYSLPLAGGKNRILYSAPAGPRRDMTVRLTYDEGKTWPVAKLLYAGLAAYSDLVVLPDGTIGCFYERDGYRKITFAHFTLGWLTDGKDQP
jgi:sialidase-1